MKTNRIQKMIHKDGLVPAGVYKAEGYFKAYDVYMNGDFLAHSVTRTYRKNEIVKIPHDTYCLFYDKLSLDFNMKLIRAYFNEISRPKRIQFLDFNVYTLNKVIGKIKVEELYKEVTK